MGQKIMAAGVAVLPVASGILGMSVAHSDRAPMPGGCTQGRR